MKRVLKWALVFVFWWYINKFLLAPLPIVNLWYNTSMSNALLQLVSKPNPQDINSGLSSLKTAKLVALFGHPRIARDYSDQCQAITNRELACLMGTIDVGPFRVTGMKVAAESLKKVFADVRQHDPELYGFLGSAGMLCVRWVRGSSETLSNHSLGFALDITLGGVLDRRGDNKVQQGLLKLYPYFHKYGWFWGAEYPTEDAMHFEVAWETFLQWVRENRFGAAITARARKLSYI